MVMGAQVMSMKPCHQPMPMASHIPMIPEQCITLPRNIQRILALLHLLAITRMDTMAIPIVEVEVVSEMETPVDVEATMAMTSHVIKSMHMGKMILTTPSPKPLPWERRRSARQTPWA